MISLLLLCKTMQFLCIMIAGYLTVKTHILRPEDSVVLSKISLYILCPCMIFSVFQIELSQSVISGLLMTLFLSILIHVMLIIAGTFVKKVFHLEGAEEAAIIYSNAGNLVMPLVAGALGNEWVIYCSSFIVIQQILLWTHGVSLFSKNKKICIRNMLCNVNVIAILICLILLVLGWKLPVFVIETLDLLSGMLGPVTMLMAGMMIGAIPWKEFVKTKHIYLLVGLRLIVFPVLTVVLCRLLNTKEWMEQGETLSLIVIIAAITSTGATILQLALANDQRKEEVSAVYILTNVGCMFTIPLITYLYLH